MAAFGLPPYTSSMNPKRIGFLGYDGVQALDLVGPLEAFMTAVNDESNGDGAPQKRYEVLVIGLTDRAFTSETGIIFHPHKTLQNAPTLDTVIIPGGKSLRSGDTSTKISVWLKQRSSRIRRVASVCTGIYALAPTGLLAGRTVTTHWRFARDLAQRFPELRVDPNALFLKDGKFYTSAGITAGIDLSLALIEEDFGQSVALSVARELVVYLKRPGGQEQYSEPLQFQVQSTDLLGDLAVWMRGHLRKDLSVEVLAERACLCPRHFSRRFKKVFGTTPAAFVESMRLGEARRRLAEHNNTIEGVGSSVGFKSAKAFRRAFERRFGLTPGKYRSHFTVHSAGESRSS
jgi:transcriptional regulator GlxA family with amidase domain